MASLSGFGLWGAREKVSYTVTVHVEGERKSDSYKNFSKIMIDGEGSKLGATIWG